MKYQLIFTLSIITLFVACKKGSEDPASNEPSCRVTELRTRDNYNDTNIYNYQYNSDGRLSSIISLKGTTTYSYADNTIISSVTQTNGQYQKIDTIVFDANHHVSYIGSNASNGYYKTVFNYDANGYVIKSDVVNRSYILDHYYTWQNGDLVVDSANDDSGTMPNVARYEYYPDKYSQYTGDHRIGGFVNYVPSASNSVHLLKSNQTGSWQILYSFDSENRILSDSTVYASSSSRYYRSYSYSCNQ